MTVIKKFYSDDKLNKGYSSKDKPHSAIKSNILPPVDVLSQYEELQPGITKRIIDLAEKEQEKRFLIEKATVDAHERAEKLGSILSLFSLMIICGTTYKIASEDITSGLIFSSIAFFSIFAISLISHLTRNISTKERSQKQNFVAPIVKEERNNSSNNNFQRKPNRKFRRRN